MCDDWDDGWHWQQFEWSLRKARKDYPCEACKTSIRKGQLYRYSRGLFEPCAEATFHVQRRCLRCDTIARAMQARGCAVAFDLSGYDGEGSRIEDDYPLVPDAEPVCALVFLTQAELEAAYLATRS